LLEVLRLSINTKQCPCCGIFWTPGQARSKGRAREFCSGKCKNVFHMDGRAQNQEATQRARAGIKRHERQGDFRLVRDIYLLNGYTEGHSNRRANEWVFVKGKSYKQFLQRERSYKGEGLIINGL